MWMHLLALAIGASPIMLDRATVPVSLRAAAGADLFTFAAILTEIGVPAGLEVRQADHRHVTNSQRLWNPAQWTPERLLTQSTLPLEEVVAAFNRAHADYQARLLDGVLVIRPTELTVPFLDRASPPAQLYAVGLMRLAEKIFAPLDPRLAQEGGRATSFSSPLGVDVDRGVDVELVIERNGLSTLGVLNEITRRAPGHSWFVVTTDDVPPQIERFGFIHRSGTTSELSIQH